MPAHRLEFAWRTDRGKVREANEDAVGVYPEIGLVIIADGMGGASAGEVASSLAVQTVSERFRNGNSQLVDRQEVLRRAEEAVNTANRVIWESGQTTPPHAGMGTTLVMGYVGPQWLVFAYVGDSRLYRLRGGNLVQLTRDHSLIQEVVDQGFFPTLEDAQRYGINQHILTRALGTSNAIRVDCGEADVQAGDIFLFCTDGLTGMVSDGSIRQVLLRPDDDLDRISNSLIALACDGGGLDNVTVALARAC
jgi:serine/threonine protein phosphatase PrpC